MSEVWERIRSSIEEERLAHAYIVEGNPFGNGRAFADRMVQHLFCKASDRGCGKCNACERVLHGTHPDIFFEEPKSKSRQIKVEQMEELLKRIHQTSFEGGWKVCIIADAQFMNQAVSNKFLKTLEEPPDRTLILLLSGEPSAMLATIRSRCQRIILPSEAGAEDEAWRSHLMGILQEGPPRDTLMLLLQAKSFEEAFVTVRKETEADMKAQLKDEDALDEDALEARVRSESLRIWHEMFFFIEQWYRDLYLLKSGASESALHFQSELDVLKGLAGNMSYDQARRKLVQIPRMARRVTRNLPIQEVFEAGLAG